MPRAHDNRCAPGVRKGRSGSCLPDGAAASAPGCATDSCVARRLGDPALAARLRPEMPATWLHKADTWLDTNDIDAVMRQYERAHPHFHYLSTLPIDAFSRSRDGSCVSQFCDLDAGALRRRGKTVIGTVLNLDRHDQPGSHWVMAAVDARVARAPRVLYYDSFGNPPPPPLWGFLRLMLATVPRAPGASARMLERSVFNARRHQSGNTECGVYSMLALEALLEGADFDSYCAKLRVDDAHARRHRHRLFSLPS